MDSTEIWFLRYGCWHLEMQFVSVGLEFQINTWPFIKIAKDVVEALGMREMMLTEVQSQLLYNIDFIKCEAQFWFYKVIDLGPYGF